MATCKECVYFTRCVVLGVELDIKHNKEADKNCRHFKNKADFVKVVRCGNCQYSFYISAKDELECRKHNGCLKYPNDFCSYGERK